MAQYAQYNPAAPQPAPVIGWYDTSEFVYPNLPATGLVEMTPDQWALHFQQLNGWTVSNNQLIAPSDE